MLVFNRDKAELEAEFRNPGIPETGLSVEELKAGLLRLAGRKKDGSRAVVKAEAFSYLLDNMRIGVSARDLFVTLGVWGRKPFDDAILPGWKQELFDGALREAAARARTLSDNGTVAFHFDFWHSVPDWDAILSLGFSGLLSRAEAAEKRFMERARKYDDGGKPGFFRLRPARIRGRAAADEPHLRLCGANRLPPRNRHRAAPFARRSSGDPFTNACCRSGSITSFRSMRTASRPVPSAIWTACSIRTTSAIWNRGSSRATTSGRFSAISCAESPP